jgi:hypothetical protein
MVAGFVGISVLKRGRKWGMKRSKVEMLRNLSFEPGSLCEGMRVLSISLLSSDVRNSGYDIEKRAVNFLCKTQDALSLFTSSLKAHI